MSYSAETPNNRQPRQLLKNQRICAAVYAETCKTRRVKGCMHRNVATQDISSEKQQYNRLTENRKTLPSAIHSNDYAITKDGEDKRACEGIQWLYDNVCVTHSIFSGSF